MKKEMNESILTTLITLPMVLLLSILKITNVLKDNYSSYLLLIIGIIFIVAFIFSLFLVLDEIMNSNNKKRAVFLITLPFVYLPIYYVKDVLQKEKLIGYTMVSIISVLIISLFVSTKEYVNSYMQDKYLGELAYNNTYSFANTNLSIDINRNYTCDNSNNNIYCNNSSKRETLSVYSYNIDELENKDISNILSSHINNIVNPLKNKGIFYEIEKFNGLYIIYYENDAVMIEEEVYGNYCVVLQETVNKKDKDVFAFLKYFENINALV